MRHVIVLQQLVQRDAVGWFAVVGFAFFFTLFFLFVQRVGQPFEQQHQRQYRRPIQPVSGFDILVFGQHFGFHLRRCGIGRRVDRGVRIRWAGRQRGRTNRAGVARLSFREQRWPDWPSGTNSLDRHSDAGCRHQRHPLRGFPERRGRRDPERGASL